MSNNSSETTINQRIIYYKRIIKCFESVLKHKSSITFKINQYKKYEISIQDGLGICHYMKELSENRIYLYDSFDSYPPELIAIIKRRGYTFNCGYWFPFYEDVNLRCEQKIKFLKEVIQEAKCIKKQQKI